MMEGTFSLFSIRHINSLSVKDYSHEFLIISCIAQDILAIPGTISPIK